MKAAVSSAAVLADRLRRKHRTRVLVNVAQSKGLGSIPSLIVTVADPNIIILPQRFRGMRVIIRQFPPTQQPPQAPPI
jgi:hypothetical protein